MKYAVVAVGFHLMLFVIFCKIEKVKICFDLNLKFENEIMEFIALMMELMELNTESSYLNVGNMKYMLN